MIQAMVLDCVADCVRVNAVCLGAADSSMLSAGQCPKPVALTTNACGDGSMARMALLGEVMGPFRSLPQAMQAVTGASQAAGAGYTC